MPEMVRVTNVGATPFRDGYANVVYHLPPNERIIVPYAAACLWFGDPDIIDRPTLARFDRAEEVERLYQRMGCYDGDDDSRVNRFATRRPQVEVSTLEGNTITMLLDHLTGDDQIPTSPAGYTDEKEALASELERMKAMQAELLQRLNTLEAGDEHFEELPTDTPTQVPVDQ